MVKAVVGEETRLESTEDRLAQSAIPSQIGLVIGKLNSKLQRGFIYDVVPTPCNDNGDPPCSILESSDKKKGTSSSKSQSQSQSQSSTLAVDFDWVAEHARQVSRLLVGGVKVVGIYIWASETVFKNSTLLLCKTVKVVADAVPCLEKVEELLLLHLSYSPRRWACRSCCVSPNMSASSLRPCDFKMGRVLNSLQTFRCNYNFHLRLPICQESLSNAKVLYDVLLDGVSNQAKELKVAKAIIDGNLIDAIADEPCTSSDVHEIELLLPLLKDASLEACSQKNVAGILVYSGTVCSYSYLNAKEPISQAVADIKEDIIISLRSRLDMISDEADRETATSSEEISETEVRTSSLESFYQIIQQPLRKQCIVPFPRRVFIPWLAGTFICDYLLPSETFEAIKDHFVELLSMEAPENDSTLLQPEKEHPRLATKSFWDVTAPFHQASIAAHVESKNRDAVMKSAANRSSTQNYNGLVTGLVLLIAIILGSLLYAKNSS